MAVRFAQQIGAQGHFHARFGQNFQGLLALAANCFNFGHRHVRQSQAGAFIGQCFVSDQGGHHESIFLCHEIGSGFVDQVAVLNASHPISHSPLDGLGRIGMGHHISTRMIRFFHNGSDFSF